MANGPIEPKLIPADLGQSDAIDAPGNPNDPLDATSELAPDIAPRNTRNTRTIRRPRISP